jgi:PAS domain S-box-containing protein
VRFTAVRQLISMEAAVAIAIAATLLAVVYREPLTRSTIEFRSADSGNTFFPYAYDDSSNGGTSTTATDPHRPLSWTCILKPGISWPYCGFGLLFDVQQNGRGLDLSRYDQVDLRIAHRGTGKMIRVTLKDHDGRYRTLANAADKVNQANFPVYDGVQSIPLTLADFAVAEWWKDQTKAPAELARPSFRNIVALEVITGTDGALGPQDFRIEQISFERHLVAPEAWYGGIALAWMVLIGSLLLHRRRQIDAMKRSADAALLESERIYRTILETSTDCIILFSPDGQFEFVNSAGLRALELPPIDETRGKHWTDFWTSDVSAVIGDAIRRSGEGESVRLHGPGPTARGAKRWWDAVTLPVFDESDYAERFLGILADHDLPPSLFEVEVTEHAFVGRATEYVARALALLKTADVSISLDDFGTGSSSLSHLRDFPVDVVKIDMSFIQQMAENDEIAAIVTAVVRLARSLSIDVIAEGVETAGQLDLLRAMGCHMAQGHFFSTAVEAGAVESLVPGKRAAA